MWWNRKETSPTAPASSDSPAALPVTRAEWRSLPPIQRVVAEHPLVNPVQRFSSSLTSWQSPGYLEPLGHRVGPEEPAGVIGDLARPRTLETPAPAMPVVQRATRKKSGLSRLWGASVQRDASDPVPVAPVEETVQLLPEEPAPLPMPSLVLPAVASREVVRPLTSAGAVALPASPPVRTVQAIREPAVEPSVVDTPAAAELPLVEPLGSDPVVSESFETAAAAPSPVEPARPTLPVVQRTEQAAPRRLGLGAPILPDVGSAPTPDAPLAGAVETTVPLADEAPEPMHDAPLPVSRLADTPPPAMPTAVQRSSPALPANAPLSSTSALKPVQRLRDESPPPPRPPGPPVMSVKDSLPALTTGKESFTDIGTPGEVTVSRMAESVPELPTVTSSRSSPINTFRPLDTPEIGSGTTEPPGMPGGSTSVSPPTPTPTPTPPLPVARAVEASSVPVARAVETPSLPVARVVETPQLPAAREVETSALPVARTVEAPDLSVARAIEESAPPATRALETPPLPISRAVDAAVPPAAREAETSQLPVARAFESSATHSAEAPVTRALATPALPVSRVVDRTPLPVARAVEDSASPVARAVETPPLPVARTLDAPAPPTASIPAPARNAEAATLPTLAVSRALEAPQTSPLPVARVVDSSAPLIQRTEAASPDVMNGPFITNSVMNGPFITSGPTTSPVAPMLTGSLPVAQRQESAAAQQLLPVARSIDSANSVEPQRPSPMLTTEPLPVARIAEPATNGRPSTPDFAQTIQRATNGSAPHNESLTLNLPPIVVSRQAEAPIVQREPEPPAPAPAPAPEAPAAPPAPAPAAPQPETDELVKKLFDPLLRRLKTELRLDRERRGALTDRPH